MHGKQFTHFSQHGLETKMTLTALNWAFITLRTGEKALMCPVIGVGGVGVGWGGMDRKPKLV